MNQNNGLYSKHMSLKPESSHSVIEVFSYISNTVLPVIQFNSDSIAFFEQFLKISQIFSKIKLFD
jgi:hypothetical protein